MAFKRGLCISQIDHLILFAVDVEAIKDCWLVGDVFLGEVFHAFQEWKSDTAANNEILPYLYEQYNISSWFKSPLLNQIHTGRILNSFIKVLNSTPKLAKYVLVFPDDDIIRSANHVDYGIICMLEVQLAWLFKHFNRLITCYRDDLKSKRQGALVSTFEPRIIWIAMIGRPILGSITERKIVGLKKCFNQLLSDLVAKERYMYILFPEIDEANPQHFTAQGKLSELGKYEYWLDINKEMRLFDRHNTELKPSTSSF